MMLEIQQRTKHSASTEKTYKSYGREIKTIGNLNKE